MADFALTSADVISSVAPAGVAVSATAINQGQYCYLNGGILTLAQANALLTSGGGPGGALNSPLPAPTPIVVALASVAAGQPCPYGAADNALASGLGTAVAGQPVALSAANPGMACPTTDIAAGQYTTILGVASAVGTLVFNPVSVGVVHA
jgi:hypothetical protein